MNREFDRSSFERGLQRVVSALEPYLGEIVIIGGWVPYLYRQYGGLSTWRGRLSMTQEVDVLVRSEIPPDGRDTIAETLRAAGFVATANTNTAAVWTNDPASGEKIEFLVPHAGPSRTLGQIVGVMQQPGVGAVALDRLDLLQRHTRRLRIPALDATGNTQLVEVCVPTLGAYVLNKAATFQDRRVMESGVLNPKRAKDLVYLQDIMGAGADVEALVHQDVVAISKPGRHVVSKAISSLDAVLKRVAGVEEASRELAERDGMTREAAEAQIRGRLGDLLDVLREVSSRRRRRKG